MAHDYRYPIEKTVRGFHVNAGSHIMVFSADGKYRGQWQPDMLGDAGEIFIKGTPDDAVYDLTKEQMQSAE